jgi:DNA-binding transcriptional MerR regulator
LSASERFLSPSEAAERLGVSAKALRLYERHGLLKPIRTTAGWRTYGSSQMARAAEIVALRALGLGLAEVGRVLRGAVDSLEPALAAHQAALEDRIRRLLDTAKRVRALRADLAHGQAPTIAERARLARPASDVRLVFELPWPWGGERFELRDIGPLNFIVGPLASGKTRLARAIAATLPVAAFIGLERLSSGRTQTQERIDADPALKSRVAEGLTRLAEDGAQVSPALVTLVVELESKVGSTLVVDMVEQGLDRGTQGALIRDLRARAPGSSPLFLLTRSNVILDLAAVGPEERIIFCPANHDPPARVAAHPGAPGYEAVATCLASPEVRSRTEGVIAVRAVSNSLDVLDLGRLR